MAKSIGKVVFNSLEEVITFIKEHENAPPWVKEAQNNSDHIKKLVTGVDFESLIIKLQHIESDKRASARKKYAKDIRSLFRRLRNLRQHVFQADGGSVEFEFKSEKVREEFQEIVSAFKGNKSIKEYLSEVYLKMGDIDPNGLLYLEYIIDDNNPSKKKVYPTYKSIHDINYYETEGQQLKVLLFKSKPQEDGKLWRVVDSEKEWFVLQKGESYTETKSSFEHPFGDVPGLVLSNSQQVGSELRFSWLHDVIKDGERYAEKSSIRTIYEIQKGTPIHWRIKGRHKGERGNERTGEGGDASKSLKGDQLTSDVTDVVEMPRPREGEPMIKDYAGYVSPDIDYLEYSSTSLEALEESMHQTLWGTVRQKNQDGDITATQVFVDIQPIHIELNKISGNVEYVHNTLANWVLNFIQSIKEKDKRLFHEAYGRRYLIETPDAVLKRYEEAQGKGLSTTMLDKLYEEWILTKYKTDPIMQNKVMVKATLEPYVHWNIMDVSNLFGPQEAAKKVQFHNWWQTGVDIKKPIKTLETEFSTYIVNNPINIKTDGNISDGSS